MSSSAHDESLSSTAVVQARYVAALAAAAGLGRDRMNPRFAVVGATPEECSGTIEA